MHKRTANPSEIDKTDYMLILAKKEIDTINKKITNTPSEQIIGDISFIRP